METAAKHRLVIFIGYLKENDVIYNESDFVKKIGIGKSFLSDMKAGRKEITEQTVLKIASVFNFLNTDWLLTGEGEMLRANHTITANIKGDGNTQVVGGGNASVGNDAVSSTKLIKELQDRVLRLEGELKAKDDIIKMFLSK